jgi:glycosyltransferase involved in cell wall biosynthesis
VVIEMPHGASGALALRPEPPVAEAMPAKTLRILYHHRVVSRDGQLVHVDDMIAALRGLGHQVAIAAPSLSGGDDGEAPGWVSWLKRSLPSALYEALELGYNVPAFLRLYRTWRDFKPDVIYERYNLNLLAGLLLAKLTHTPLLLEVNAPLAQERASHSGGLRLHPMAWRIENFLWRSADRILPVSGPLAALLQEARVKRDRITVIPNGIDPAMFDGIDSGTAKRALGLGGKLVLGFAGFMRDWHGLDAVIEALAQPGVPDNLHFLLLGDGPARKTMEQRAVALGVADRVTFTGIVPRAELGWHVAAFDIALQPKAVAYASPLKLFDYMAAGKAIVAPDQANICEIVTHEDSALLFDPRRPTGMLDAVLRLVADAGLRQHLGRGARRQIENGGFTWRQNAQRVAALGTELTNAGRDGRGVR